ncbi:MAG TPA: hypothetical protein VJ841_04705 [Candidatus Saccharimonadales bacterium]|nr:hypothetical protein [Candidatus Saccharimonadales bacterium]
MKRKILMMIVSIATFGLTTVPVGASPNIQLQQTINAGVLSVDVMDASQVSVASPSSVLTTLATSASCRPTGATGTLGTNSQRIYVDNPGAANNGWSLAIGATAGSTSVWNSGSSTYDFNDQTSSGCSDGADADTVAGKLSLDPSVSTITTDCSNGCTTANVTKGVASSFNEGTTDSIELANASAAANHVWRGYVTGVNETQSIPAGQTPGAYTLNMTLTATAL